MIIPTTISTTAHGNNPFRIGHLIIHLTKSGGHLISQGTSDNHHIWLTRGGTKDNTKSIEIISTRTDMHHFNCTARQTKRHWPQWTHTSPIHERIYFTYHPISFTRLGGGREELRDSMITRAWNEIAASNIWLNVWLGGERRRRNRTVEGKEGRRGGEGGEGGGEVVKGRVCGCTQGCGEPTTRFEYGSHRWMREESILYHRFHRLAFFTPCFIHSLHMLAVKSSDSECIYLLCIFVNWCSWYLMMYIFLCFV